MCTAITVIDNATPVRVLQHPDEARHALNTARWVARGLRNARVLAKDAFEAGDWEVHGRTPLLLYPDEPSAPAQPLPDGPYVLVVLDGTWRQAATLLRTHPALYALKRLVLSVPTQMGSASVYRLRKAPRSDSYATVEAVATALDVLDAPQRHDALLRPFTLQIERQIALQRAKMGELAFCRNYPNLAGN